ncbi:MAG: hypothetical protein ACREC0_03430 [Methylocella sp.]
MAHELEKLLEAAKRIAPSTEQKEEQRRSFAYGNTAFENDLITREMVRVEAERLDQEKNERSSGPA